MTGKFFFEFEKKNLLIASKAPQCSGKKKVISWWFIEVSTERKDAESTRAKMGESKGQDGDAELVKALTRSLIQDLAPSQVTPG